MGSLHRHLQLQGPEHDRLAFRPDCPICHTRLSGRYPEARPLSPRQGAAAATGLVAIGALLPPGGALADEPDRLAVPTPAPPPAVVTDDDDGGGEIPPLGDGGEHVPSTVPSAPEAAPAPPPKVEIDVPRVEVEVPPPEPPAAPTPEPEEPPAAEEPAPAPEAPAPVEPAPAPEPPAPVPRETAPAPEQPAPAPQESAPPPEQPAPSSDLDPAPHSDTSGRPSPTSVSGGERARGGGGAGGSNVEGSARARTGADGASEGTSGREKGGRSEGRGSGDRRDLSPERAPRVEGERNREPGRGASTHVVEAGQSLWLIAESVLGNDASDAQVAAEVERLWQLNAERIATGNPNLIYPGQELRLR